MVTDKSEAIILGKNNKMNEHELETENVYSEGEIIGTIEECAKCQQNKIILNGAEGYTTDPLADECLV